MSLSFMQNNLQYLPDFIKLPSPFLLYIKGTVLIFQHVFQKHPK